MSSILDLRGLYQQPENCENRNDPDLVQTILHMRKRFPEWVHCQVVWILGGNRNYSAILATLQITFAWLDFI
jgi:hypothetical protein